MIIECYSDGVGSVELIDHMGDDKRAVDAARVSFMRDDTAAELVDKDKRLIKFLIDHKHTSPFEHMVVTFRITCPLFVRSQIMRHRTFSYNEVSRRYTSERLQFWKPAEIRSQSSSNLQCSDGLLEPKVGGDAKRLISELIDSIAEVYQVLINVGVSREQARAVLPQSTYTEFYMTGNLMNWCKFLRLRLDSHAQPETREIAEAIETILTELYPVTMATALK